MFFAATYDKQEYQRHQTMGETREDAALAVFALDPTARVCRTVVAVKLQNGDYWNSGDNERWHRPSDFPAANVDDVNAQLDELTTRAVEVYTARVQSLLDALEARYPRHRFALFDAMGATFISVDPPFMRQSNLCTDYFPTESVPPCCKKIVDDLFVNLNEIIGVCEMLDEKFNHNFGHIKSSRGDRESS